MPYCQCFQREMLPNTCCNYCLVLLLLLVTGRYFFDWYQQYVHYLHLYQFCDVLLRYPLSQQPSLAALYGCVVRCEMLTLLTVCAALLCYLPLLCYPLSLLTLLFGISLYTKHMSILAFTSSSSIHVHLLSPSFSLPHSRLLFASVLLLTLTLSSPLPSLLQFATHLSRLFVSLCIYSSFLWSPISTSSHPHFFHFITTTCADPLI